MSDPAEPARASAALRFESRAERVTFFEDRAEVCRVATCSLPREALARGALAVALAGVSPAVDDRSASARVLAGPARVAALRVRRAPARDEGAGAGTGATLRAREDDAAQAQLDEARAEAQRARAQGRLERAEVALRAWCDGLAQVPRGLHGEGGAAGAWREAFARLAEEADAATTELHAAQHAQREAEQRRARAQQRAQAARVESPRWEALVELALEGAANELSSEADEPTAALTIEVTYRVPCALWRPEHVARLLEGAGDDGDEDDDGRAHVARDGAAKREARARVQTFATAWQQTGEDWGAIEAVFSTARPARDATAPLLTEDVLTARRKTEHERKRVVVDAREQAVQTAGLERGARAVDEMPGVDDGGEPRVFRAPGRVRVPSDGRPVRFEVHAVEVPVTVERVLYPEKAPVAHLRATATLAGKVPLLAGPVRVARGGSVVGRATLGYVGPGEPFELGFGADDSVRVRREASDKRETVPVVGTQKLERTVRVYLSNLSGEERSVLVTERVPLSELEELEVLEGDAQGFRFESKKGFARAEVTLAPRATRELKLVYELRASAKVVLPF